MDYTPYEGRSATGWPVIVINRGRVVVKDSELQVERGSGVYLQRDRSDAARPSQRLVPEMNPATNFNANLI